MNKNTEAKSVTTKDIEKEVAQTLVFQSKLVKGGEVTIDRSKLVSNIQEERRSYANNPLTISEQTNFQLPELKEQYKSGFKIGLVVYLPDNAKGDKKKGQLEL
jgi:hypothetical protein